ncbi:hypothetical protein Q8A67_012356 [Cirrhinus molitorella]|uniref:Uncharacterized protein n=1 Tax=Cirrhinus molitorella TaxID=172907 RepID=A0AA88TP12_9TELE|nr:hypothetical protein Q8A67_012356 [Cirrhinus molitorella]
MSNSTVCSFFQLLKDTSKVKLYYVSEEEVEKKDESLSQVPLFTIKGTMKMHEVLSVSPGILKYRDISCFCQAAEGVFDCPCHSLEEVTLVATDEIDKTGNDFRPSVIEQHHSGQWCVVQYDDDPYPGIILQVEENNVKVKCMHRNGVNKFFWPTPRDDVNWYSDDQIMCLIPEPQALNKRSVQIDKRFWEFIMSQLGNTALVHDHRRRGLCFKDFCFPVPNMLSVTEGSFVVPEDTEVINFTSQTLEKKEMCM